MNNRSNAARDLDRSWDKFARALSNYQAAGGPLAGHVATLIFAKVCHMAPEMCGALGETGTDEQREAGKQFAEATFVQVDEMQGRAGMTKLDTQRLKVDVSK
jgi:hypothetical protein